MHGLRILFLLFLFYSTYSQTTNFCGNADCLFIGSLKYEDLCKKPTDITESTRKQICGSLYTNCIGFGCKSMCNCKVYTVANCCYSGKQCTSDFVKIVCGSMT